MTAFKHGVASGDPTTDRVVVWTRFSETGAQGPAELPWEVAQDPDFLSVVGRGSVDATEETDASTDTAVSASSGFEVHPAIVTTRAKIETQLAA